MIPGVLIAGAFFVHDQVTQKQKRSATSSITQEVLPPSNPSNNAVQALTPPNLLESGVVNGEPIHTHPTPDTELSWLDRPIRGELLKALKRDNLIHSGGKVESFNTLPPSSQTDLLGAKLDKVDPRSSGGKGVLPQNLLSTTGQAPSGGLFIANNTTVSLSGIDLFSNPLTSADLFEPKLIKADFRGASFGNEGLTGIDFPGASLLGGDSVKTTHLSVATLDLSQANVLNAAPTSPDASDAKLINIALLGAHLSKIDIIENGFGVIVLDDSLLNIENLPNPNPSSDGLTPQAPVAETPDATDSD